MDILHREAVYLWYYFSLQLSQIFRYWVLGSVISVFAKERIHGLFRPPTGNGWGFWASLPPVRWELRHLCVCTERFPWPRPSPRAEWRMIGLRHL